MKKNIRYIIIGAIFIAAMAAFAVRGIILAVNEDSYAYLYEKAEETEEDIVTEETEG